MAGKSEENQARADVLISGRVQGVNFRWYTQRQAQELDLTGWVRNRGDGTGSGRIVSPALGGRRGGARRGAQRRTGGPRAAATEDRTFPVPGPLGESVVTVRDGRAHVEADPGPRQYCVRQGSLARAGNTALCLPNQVSVELVGRSRPYDSLSY